MAKDEKAAAPEAPKLNLDAISAAAVIAALNAKIVVLERENSDLKKKHVEHHQKRVGKIA